LPVICIDARHAKASLKMQINKSDRNDAVGIARIMQCGWYKEVRVKDLDSHAVKALLVSRALLVKIKRDLENQIRGLLKNFGLVIGRAKMNVFAARAAELIQDRPELTAAVVRWLIRHDRPRIYDCSGMSSGPSNQKTTYYQ
jgi:transposase